MTMRAEGIDHVALKEQPPFLRDMWYVAMPGRFLKRGKAIGKVLLNDPILLGRDKQGKPFALRNICAHRGMPLDYGRFDGSEVECAYHGWRFGTDGVCTAIPALVEGQDVDVSRIFVRRYPCEEVQGNIWVYFGDPNDDLPPVPRVPGSEEQVPALAQTQVFPVNIDHAVVGLIDPAHVPFVHRSSWYRPAGSMHEKSKRFVPIEFGFRMVRHAPSKNSLLYRLLGGAPETQIDFQLPGLRIEHIQVGRHSVVGLTAITPISEQESEVHHMMYWTVPWLNLVKPIAQILSRTFLNQDRRIVAEQSRGLRYDPQLMMIHDADTLARWYYQLKREYVHARQEGRPFNNCVQDTVLRWQT
ncbi:MAG: aromatic ring-hydroxylating dioxygenase subunit alpha [Gemmatimonadota bacterium]